MRLLPRRALFAAIPAALLVLIALPFTWTDQAPWHGVAPTLSYAGGSPDETLNPPAYPPGTSGHSAAIVRPDIPSSDRDENAAAGAGRSADTHTLTRGDYLLAWWVNVASLLRF